MSFLRLVPSLARFVGLATTEAAPQEAVPAFPRSVVPAINVNPGQMRPFSEYEPRALLTRLWSYISKPYHESVAQVQNDFMFLGSSVMVAAYESQILQQGSDHLSDFGSGSLNMIQGLSIALAVVGAASIVAYGARERILDIRATLILQGVNPEKRIEAVQRLFLNPDQNKDILMKIAQEDPSPEVRRNILFKLYAIGAIDSIVLLEKLEGLSPEKRIEALQSLDLNGVRNSAILMKIAKENPSPKVRKQTIAMLAQIDEIDTIMWLAINDPDIDVRIETSKHIQDTAFLRELAKKDPNEKDPNELVQHAAVLQLYKLKAFDVLEGIIDDDDFQPTMRIFAGFLLKKIL